MMNLLAAVTTTITLSCVATTAFDASRRSMLLSAVTASTPSSSYLMCNSNALLPREINIEVPDPAATVLFFTQALGMIPVKSESGDLAVAYGPTDLTRPPNFYPGISVFDEDGGHCSVVVRRGGTGNVGDNFAYMQLAMPFIRASKLMAYGGQIVEAYGVVNVVAPGGIPLKLLVGDEVKDRIQYVALRVRNVKDSERFYVKAVGMRKTAYPRARPITKEESPFDPNPPKGSAYLEFCQDSPGLLLLPSERDVIFRPTKPKLGDVYRGYSVLSSASTNTPQKSEDLVDPSGNTISILRQ